MGDGETREEHIMRKFAILFELLVIMAMPCVAQKHNLIESDQPFGSGATINLYNLLKMESGLLNGVRYEFFYSDGSGRFAATKERAFDAQELSPTLDWSVGCEKDAITDEKSCYVDRDEFRVWVDARGRSRVYIGSNYYPGSNLVIRIDRTPPVAINSRMFHGSFGYRSSPRIISRIASAKTVTTRYHKWPYKDYEDSTWSTYGFKEALAYIKWAVARIR
jgi:hypothetical protein